MERFVLTAAEIKAWMLKFEVRHPDDFWIDELKRYPRHISGYVDEHMVFHPHLYTRQQFIDRSWCQIPVRTE